MRFLFQSAFYCQATTPATSSLTQVTSNSSSLNSLVCQELIGSTPQTRNLDDFVNCTADSHISPKSEPFISTASISPQSTTVESSPNDDSFNSRYQINSHNLLSASSNDIVVQRKEGFPTGENIIDSRSNALDNLVTSVTTQMLSKSKKIDDSSSETCLNDLMTSSNSSPLAQSVTTPFSTAMTEVKSAALSSPETQSQSQSPAQSKDIPYSTKTEVESDMNSRMKSSSVPLAVKEIPESSQKIGDMFVPAGPAPPLTGMVPQEMVKMTDNDLISYINPSCFDQG